MSNPLTNLIINILFIKLVGGYNNYTIVIMAVTADYVTFIAVLLYLILTMFMFNIIYNITTLFFYKVM